MYVYTTTDARLELAKATARHAQLQMEILGVSLHVEANCLL